MATRGRAHTATFTAWDTAANAPKTGDAANITPRYCKDGTSAALTTATVTEVDATNFPGLYKVALSSSEADADMGVVGGKSSTADVVIIPTKIEFERLPDAAPGASGGVPRVSDLPAAAPSAAANAAAVWAEATRTLTAGTNLSIPTAAAIADAVWDEAQSGHVTAGTFGAYLDASVSGVSTGGVSAGDIATAVWATATRTLSAGTNIVLAKGTGITGFNDLDAAGVRTALGMAAADLDTQLDAILAGGGAVPAWSGTLATVTSTGGTFAATLPAMDLTGYLLEVNGHTYEGGDHTAGAAAFTLKSGAWKVTPSVGDTVKAYYFEGSDTAAAAAERTALLAAWDAGTVSMRNLTAVTAPTRGDCLAAAAALAAGDETLSGVTYTRKHLDGTSARVFVLDDAETPTSRT